MGFTPEKQNRAAQNEARPAGAGLRRSQRMGPVEVFLESYPTASAGVRPQAEVSQSVAPVPRPRKPVEGPTLFGGHRVRHGYRPDLEGLRALAMLLIAAAVAGVPGLAGGFIGVDLLLVVSGYLVTRAMIAETVSPRGFSVGDFYIRRIRRVMLPALLVLLLTGAAGLAVLRQDRSGAALDFGAASLGLANWRFWQRGEALQGTGESLSLVYHFWAISVLVQLLALAPLVFWAAHQLARRYRTDVVDLAFSLTIALTALSFSAAVLLTFFSPELAYFSTPTRAWAFGAGATVALAILRHPRFVMPPTQAVGTALGWAGLGAIAASALVITPTTAYPGVWALGPVLGTVALLMAGAMRRPRTHFNGTATSLLSVPIAQGLGRLSYAWYLWHWPVYALVVTTTRPLSASEGAMVMGLALGVAFVVHEVVEPPARSVSHRLRPFGTALATVLVAAAVGLGLLGAGLATGNTGPTEEPSTATAQDLLGPVQATSGATTPAPEEASADVPAPDCLAVEPGQSLELECSFGPVGGERVVLLGDGHAQQWQTALQTVADARAWRVEVRTISGCPVVAVARPTTAQQERCAAWRDAEFERLVSDPPALVVMSQWNGYTADAEVLSAGWQEVVERLAPSDAELTYLFDTPAAVTDPVACVAANLSDWTRCRFSITQGDNDRGIEAERAGTRAITGLKRVDLTSYLCEPDGTCPAVRNGVLLYRDRTHLSDTTVGLLGTTLADELAAQLAARG